MEEEQKKRKEGKSDGGCGQSHRLPDWGPRAGATVFTAGERERGVLWAERELATLSGLCLVRIACWHWANCTRSTPYMSL